MKCSRVSEPVRLALKYTLIAAAWIVTSDFLLSRFTGEDEIAQRWNTVKGLGFVLVTGLILHALATRMQGRIHAAERSRQDELRRVNEHLQRAKGLLAALARANQATLTAREEEALCREIGSALVGLAGLRFVWFGWVDEQTLRVVPGAWAGDAPGYIEGLVCTIDPDDAHGRGPTGTAIRENRIVACDDLRRDDALLPWRPQTDRHGFLSSASVPIRFGARRGAFSAYAGQTGYFDAEIAELLRQLASDLEHGLGLIAARAERERVDARLRESEARYRALFENEHVAMLLVDPVDGAIREANPAAAAFYGWSREELVRKNAADLNLHPPERILADMGLAVSGGQRRFQFRHRRADSSVRDVEIFSGPVVIDGRELLCSIIHDVTDRLAAEQALADALALNEVAIDSSPLGMVIYDPEGLAVRANPAALRILGTSADELEKHHLRTPAWPDQGRIAAAERALALGSAQSIETHIAGPDGARVELAATFSPFAFHGRRHLLATLEDVTEKRRVLARLHLMQTAIEAAPSAIIVADPVGRIEWVNPAFVALTGYSLEQVSGRNPSILKSGRQGPAFYEEMWSAISRGHIWSGDLQNQRRDGSIYWEHMIIAPVISPSGAIEHYIAIKQDISGEKELEHQVARTQRLESIGLLAGGIAHDLNNVLAPILMAMDLFKMRYTDPADQARLEIIRKSAERGAGIVRQVLTFARGVEGERMTLRPEHLIKEVRNLLQETLPRLIEIVVDLEPGLPSLLGDATQLHQVLLNLGVNARDAMPRGGVLTFGARRMQLAEPLITQSGLKAPPGDYVVLSVRDTGCGISPEVMEHMFEPFYTTKPRGAGTGLGLSTVLGIVRGHGGGLDVVSQPGKGTEFRVLLPATATSSPPRAEPQAGVAGAGRTVLVVDDEEAIRVITALALQHHGFAHVEAEDGRAAMEIFSADPGRFSAVVLDHIMPHIGGEEVAARIKAVRPDLPIILISGMLSESATGPSASEAYRVHGDLVLRKPFSQSDLISALAKVLPAA